MFSRLRAKKAGGRKDRPAPRDGTESSSSPRKENPQTTPTEGPVSTLPLSDGFVRPGTSDSRKSIAAAAAPTLPPIPRVASQIGRDSVSSSTPSSPQAPTIRTVALHGQSQPSAYESSASPLSDDGDLAPTTEHVLEPISSLDRAKADSQADKDNVDALLMPPPPSTHGRPLSVLGKNQLRSWTDFHRRPSSSKVPEDPPPSRGSSTINSIPVHYQLDEPKDYITPTYDGDDSDFQSQQQQQQRPRSRLTRLNPLSYLSRKKVPQEPVEGVDTSALAKRASYTPFKDVSQTFDPRIIGARIHDFSTPMPSQYQSHQDLRSVAAMNPPPSSIYLDPRRGSDSNLPQHRSGEPSPERRHVPVFKEDFGNSAEGWRLDPADRRNRMSTNIVDKVAELEEVEKNDRRKSSLPAFAQHMPQDVPNNVASDMLTPPQVRASPGLTPEQDFLYTPNSIQRTPDSLKPPKETPRPDVTPGASPLADRSQIASPETPGTLSSLPRHLRSKTASVRSTASRFSFDMVGSGSAAQEKMLEEKHRQRQAQRVRATSLTGASINEEDDFDEDDFEFDDDYEEEIPGMGDDEYGFGGRGVADMTLEAPTQGNGLIAHEECDETILDLGDVDEDDDEFGTAGLGGGLGDMTLESIQPAAAAAAPVTASRHMPSSSDGSIKGLGLRTDLASTSRDAPVSTPIGTLQYEEVGQDTSPSHDPENQVDIDSNDVTQDGFYFDDGEFDDEFMDENAITEGAQFDESTLDDDFVRGQPLSALKSYQAPGFSTVKDSSGSSTRPTSLDSDLVAGQRHSGLTADTSRNSMQARRSSAYGQHDEAGEPAGLTQENLAAYHNALAFATNQAALQGRFDRTPSGQSNISSPSNTDMPGIQQQKELQRRMMMPPPPPPPPPINTNPVSMAEDYDFDFDDMGDDAIIAAANAEALENDDDGMYGSEFGFYANTNGSVEVESFHGGFFGPAGMGNVKRSHSGRADFQEPSLTPITERSEWSNRNSMISLAMQSGISPGGLSIPAPGLAQLADQMQLDGSMDDMSLGALMRARRTAFGSSTSLHSLGAGGSRSGSPSQYAPLHSGPSPLNGGYGYPPSVPEDGVPYRVGPSIGALPNPMLSLQTQNLSLRPTTSSSDSSPLKRASATRERPGHSRNSSSAESVSYAMERDDEGGNQWIVEKRRTLDNGETEVFGREVVRGTL